MARADANECELIAKTNIKYREHGYLYNNGNFTPDSATKAPLRANALSKLARSGIPVYLLELVNEWRLIEMKMAFLMETRIQKSRYAKLNK